MSRDRAFHNTNRRTGCNFDCTLLWGQPIVKRLLVFAIVLFAATRGATAEEFYRAASSFSGPHPAVVRIVAPERGSASYGSGALVAVNESSGLVLTNWHVVRDATSTIVVYFPDGFHSGAYLLRTDSDWDLAALAIRRPNVQPIPIANDAPKIGEEVTIAGYGSGSYRSVTGRVTQYVSPGGNHPYEMLELSAPARNGDSGGPILNARGELAGTLFGSAFGRTAGSYCGRLRWFVQYVDADFRRISLQAMLAQQGQRAPAVVTNSPTAGYNDGTVATAVPQPVDVPQPTAVALSPNPGPAAIPAAGAYATNYSPSPAAQTSVSLQNPTPNTAMPTATTASPGQPAVAEKTGMAAPSPAACAVAAAPNARASAAPLVAIGASPNNSLLPRNDQFKSILALVGTIAVLYHAIRFLGWAVG
jgi:hypothetical protein